MPSRRKTPIPTACAVCGEVFDAWYSKSKYCSIECSSRRVDEINQQLMAKSGPEYDKWLAKSFAGLVRS